MKRVLHLLSGLDGGDVEQFLITHYRRIDRTQIHFDFVVQMHGTGILEAELRDMGSQIWHLPPYRENPVTSIWEMHGIIRAGNYDAVVAHQDAVAIFPLWFAKRYGVPVRVAHCHNAISSQPFWRAVLTCAARLFLPLLATRMCACSRDAAVWLFGERAIAAGKVRLIHNAIEPNRYAFSPETRACMRRELGLESTLVIGHVARLCTQKNQRFLLEIFRELVSLEPSARLVMVGRGKLEPKLRATARALGIVDRVLFLGVRKDVGELLGAFDLFLLPSLHEGLGIALVEAQMSGLPCLTSAPVPREVDLTGLVKFYNLARPAADWAKTLLAMRVPESDRKSHASEIRAAGYDVAAQAAQVAAYYAGEPV